MLFQKTISKKYSYLLISLAFTSVVSAQNKVVDYISPNKLHNFSDAQKCELIEVPNKGVLVSYSTIKTSPSFNFGPTLLFFDKDLNKKWELTDYSPSEMNKAYFQWFYGYGHEKGVLRISNCYVDPSGKYAYSVNFTTSIINKIDIESGEVTKISLTPKLHTSKQGVPEYSLDAFIDKDYFYLIEGNKFNTNAEAKKRPSVYVIRIKHGDTQAETFTLNPEIASEEKGGAYKHFLYPDIPLMRKWENLLINNNNVILLDNRTIENKETKEFYRKINIYPLDGSQHKELMIKMGEEIISEGLLGEVMYDNKHNRIYTYSMNKKNGELIISYRCYNAQMGLIWEKDFDTNLGKQVIQKIFNSAKLNTNYDNSISITSRYGDNYYTLRTDKNGDNPEFFINEKCSQGKLRKDDGYTLDCFEFNSLQNVKGLKSYILKDKNNSENKFEDETEFFQFGNKLILAKTLKRKPGYRLVDFDMP